MTRARRELCGTMAVAVIVFAIAVIRFSGVAIMHGPDADDVLVPMFFDISRSIGEHGLFAGMYNSGLVAGLSYWGSPSFHPLYPFYFNWLGSDTTILDTLDRLKVVFFLHMAIHAAGSYMVARVLGLFRWPATAVGVAASFLPAFQSVGTWPPIAASLAWLPWIMFFQMRIYKRGWSPGSAVGLAVCVGLLIHAQPAQNLVLAFIGSVVLGVIHGGMVLHQKGRREGLLFLRPRYASFALAAGLIVLACYPYMSGVMAFHDDSIRWLGDGRDITGKDRLPLSALKAHAMGWKALVAPFVFAKQFSVVVGNLYIGAPIALACLVYPFLFRRRPLASGLLTSIALATAFCFVFFGWLLYMLPVANKVREVNWWSCYVATMALPVGAWCLRRLLRLLVRVRRRRGSWHVEMVVLAAPLLTAIGVLIAGELRWQVALAGAMGLFLWFALRAGKGSGAAVAVVMLLVVSVPFVGAERPPLGQSMIVRSDRMEQRHSMQAVFKAVPQPENYRIQVSEQLPDYKVLTHQLANLGARGIRGDLNPQRRSKFELLYFPRPAVARLYGIRYAVVAGGTEGSQPVDARYALQQDDAALSRLFVATSGLAVVDSPVAALQGVTGEMVEHIYATPQAVAKLGVDLSSLQAGIFTAHAVEPWENSPVAMQALVETDGPALLVLNEDVEGHWYAIIDGDVRQGVAVNGFQTAFMVPGAGRHSVVIRRPSGLTDALAGLPTVQTR